MTTGTRRTTTPNIARVLFASLPLAALCLVTACSQQADAEDAASERATQDNATDAAPARSEARRTESPTPDATRPNAADEYRRIWNAIEEDGYFTIAKSRDDPTREAEELLNETLDLYEALVEATKLDHCDWGIDYSDGLDTLVPHLGHMRRLTRYLVAHANSAVRWTDMDRARDATLSVIRMSRHIEGKSPIEDLVAMASLEVAVEIIIDHRDEWREQDRKALLDELQEFNTDNLFGLEASLEWDLRVSSEAGQPPPDKEAMRNAHRLLVERLQKAIEALQ